MATKEETKPRELSTKYYGANGRFFRGIFLQKSPGVYAIKISEQKTNEGEKEETTTEEKLVKVDRLRPLGKMDAKERNARQKEIDAYLKDNELSALEAIATVTKKVKGKNVESRQIEDKLGYEVERFLVEERKLEEIKIVRLSTEVTYKDVVEIPVFVKLLPHQFRKSLINYINSL